MCDGIVIEAHTIRKLRDDIVRARGPRYKMLEWLAGNCRIVMTDKIRSHWDISLGNRGAIVLDWLEQINHKKSVNELKEIKRVHRDIRRKMRNEFGLTGQSFVMHYIDCANTTEKPKYIIAEDIFFYDPKADSEGWGEGKKEEIKTNKVGRLQRYINIKLKIKVRNIYLCITDVNNENRDCSKRLSSHDCALS